MARIRWVSRCAGGSFPLRTDLDTSSNLLGTKPRQTSLTGAARFDRNHTNHRFLAIGGVVIALIGKGSRAGLATATGEVKQPTH